MKRALIFTEFALFAAIPAFSQAGDTTATVRLHAAIVSTAEGRRAAVRMEAEWAPALASLEKKQADIGEMVRRLDEESRRRHGIWPFRHAMSRRHKAMLEAQIAQMAKSVQRERDDRRADFEEERLRIMNELGQRMRTVVENYAREHGYLIILNSGSARSPVPVSVRDLTEQVVKLYDEAYPARP